MKTHAAFFLALLTLTAHADPRTSTNYIVVTDAADSGGKRTTSASYTNDGSAGGIVGVSTVATPAETAKHGYIGQLTEVTALQLVATPMTVNEGGTRQLSGVALLDDLTTNIVPVASITWSIQSGPLIGINTNGLVTAATVYQDTLATGQGVYAGHTGTLGLTVLNVNTDDIPGYSSDGLDDAWQVQYFGLNNPNAAPTLDSDFDGQTNFFEFIAGLSPISGTSRFLIDSAPVPNQPGQMNIVISPRLPDRTYTVQCNTTLASTDWAPLTTFTTTDAGQQRTITDTSATGTRKFYRVQITKP
ncbi:hypothetical protein [Prosthecobacter sp.]|uniref:hypothetical protein n=1 Tax=Prosthecobacter sp. TaxID=1965333 RepID=UPI002AB83723|nr:hypothetical protein [Prosthecobacter sp.]MDZ4405426.1 hypothetical protein [Prosthecobacter sp.]